MSGEILNSPTNKMAMETELEFLVIFSGLPETVIEVREIISPEDFYLVHIRKCYEYLLSRYDKDGVFITEDMMSFVQSNDGEEALQSVKVAVAGIITFNADGVISRAKRIRQYSLYRQTQNIAEELTYITPETVIDGAESAFQKLAKLTEAPEKKTMKPIQDGLVDYVGKKYSGNTGKIVPTYYPKFDSILSLFNTDLIVLAARPSIGKSAFITNVATKTSFHGYTTGLFSLEMSKEQVLDRIFASVGQIPYVFLTKNSIEGKYSEALGKAATIIHEKCALLIDDTACITVNEIKHKCIENKVQIAIIDYLQLLKPNGGRKYANKVDEVSEITRDLKIMAGELNIPVILLSQLNRDVEKRLNSRPQLSDLRDSGSIEQDANSVIFLSKTNPDDEHSDILVDIAKNRSGPVGKVIYQFDRNTQTFRETEQEYQPPEGRKREY